MYYVISLFMLLSRVASSLMAVLSLQYAARFLQKVVECCSWVGCYTTCPSTSWAGFSTTTTTSPPCSSAVCLQVKRTRKGNSFSECGGLGKPDEC